MTNRKKSPHHLQEVGGPLMIMIKISGLEVLGIVTLTINSRVVILGSGDDRNSSIGDFFSLTEFTNGKSVVKLWDNLGLGLGLNLDNSCGSRNAAFSFYDINKEQKICSIFGSKCDNFAAVSTSPSVVVSAETNLSGHSSLSLWDTRIGFRVPEVSAELRHMLGKIAGVSGGVEKVYVRDDVTGELTVGDMRKASSPLVNVTESDMDTWWDADAVIVDDECEDSV
ncbi:hypothetical protein OIU77_012009 [Salix suchowensis]|uniref:Uncharacterized protein n=1 Tax=Salix suchowensis TaxID=1278906 RepID=A0ABQ9A2C2_9ROSI|nr:hypothetical protein OIU77_012009 [Salix suchowensis]